MRTFLTTAVLATLAIAIGMIAGPGQALAATSPRFAETKPHTAPTPFLYRPYYGSAPLLARAASLFDHDQPWYTQDHTFVRYDGQVFAGTAVTNCQAYVSCYDGHNGYDLNMVFEPVLAAGAGTVIRAGWYNAANHSDGFGLWVAIDHGNGYYTAYGHLSAIDVVVGQVVTPQMQIGTSGSSGSATGPHLHFSVFTAEHWQPTDPFGWRGTSPDPNTVPDDYLWVSNPVSPSQSPNLGSTGALAYHGALVTDDRASNFTTTGTWQSASGPNMISTSMRWTNTVAGAATATATWQPRLTVTGYYAVGVYITPVNATSQWAPYTVTSQLPPGVKGSGTTMTSTIYVDQAHIGIFQGPYGQVDTGPRWVSLGTYYFAAGTVAKISLSNATGEVGQQLGADAIEFVPVPAWNQAPGNATPVAPTTVPGQHRNP